MRYRGDGGANGGMNYISAVEPDDGPDCVPTLCLDDFCDDHGISSIDLVKVDVQGHEHKVLMGAQRLLSSRSYPHNISSN